MSRKFGIEIEAGNETIKLPVDGDGWNLVERLRKHAKEGAYGDYVEDVNICVNIGNNQPIFFNTDYLLTNANDIQWLFAYNFAAYWMQRLTKKGRRYFRRQVYDMDAGFEELRQIVIEASEITE